MELLLWIFVLIIGLAGSFIDSAFKMGYGLATPTLILLGFDPIVIIALLLFSQLFAGFTKTIYYSLYRKIHYAEMEKDLKLNLFYILTGMIGMTSSILLIFFLPEYFILIYIALMIFSVGILTLFNIKLLFSPKKFYIISLISGFNQTLSAAGYGPLAAYQEFLKNGDYKKTRPITAISEAILSGFGFLLYFVLFNFLLGNLKLMIILIITGMIGTPLGAISGEYLNKRKAKKLIGILSIIFGIILLIYIFINNILVI